MYFDILRNAVVQCLGDGRDLREGDCARGDEGRELTQLRAMACTRRVCVSARALEVPRMTLNHSAQK
jgi:hypothetical protein